MSKERIVQSLREHMAALGHDVSDLTDEEIEAGVMEFARIASGTGLSVCEAIQALAAFTAAIRDLPPEVFE